MQSNEVSRRKVMGGGAALLTLPALSSCGPAPIETEVLIIGAGLSGLYAARLLEAQGVKVQVIEGRKRVGGRCWTNYDVAGRPEMGATQVGWGYGRIRSTAEELGVELVAPPAGAGGETQLPPLSVSVGGLKPDAQVWATSAMNKLRDDEKQISPLALLMHYLLKDNPLVGPEDWQQPKFAPLDQLTLRQYLQQRGASDEALRLLDVNIPAWELNQASALDYLRKNHYYAWEAKNGPFHVVKKGTSALTDAMAKSLKAPVLLERPVTRIEARKDGVKVSCGDGSVFNARLAICTIPPTAMRGVTIDGPVPEDQRKAWASLPYSQLINVFFKLNTPYWEKDGLAKSVWTDGPAEMILYAPSLGDPAGYVFAYINGKGVERYNGMTDAAIATSVHEEIKRLRPAMGAAITPTYVRNWVADPFARGHVAVYQPGGLTRYGAIIGQPVGALHFAGEHLCRVHAGMEGACESAEATGLAALSALGKY